MKLASLKGLKEINGYKIMVMDDLREEQPELFNESGSMDYAKFEKDIRPHHHIYVRHDVGSISFTIQSDPVSEVGVNGCQVDEIIAVAHHMLKNLNAALPCEESEDAINSLEFAMECLKNRKERREKLGIEGTMEEKKAPVEDLQFVDFHAIEPVVSLVDVFTGKPIISETFHTDVESIPQQGASVICHKVDSLLNHIIAQITRKLPIHPKPECHGYDPEKDSLLCLVDGFLIGFDRKWYEELYGEITDEQYKVIGKRQAEMEAAHEEEKMIGAARVEDRESKRGKKKIIKKFLKQHCTNGSEDVRNACNTLLEMV